MNNVEEWNNAYSVSGEGHKNKYPSDAVVSWVMRNFRGTEAICLDIGCGYGNNLRFLLNEGFNAFGCDISEIVIDDVKDEFGDRVLVNEPNNLPYDSEKFQFVIDRSSLQHNTLDDITKIVNECHRVLKDGGQFFSIMLKEGDNGFILGCPSESFLKNTVLRPFKSFELNYITVTENNAKNQFTSYLIHAKK